MNNKMISICLCASDAAESFETHTHTQKILWQILNESNWDWVKFRICFSTTVRQCHKFDRGRGDSVFCFAFFEEGLEDFKFGSDSKILRCSAPASANHHVVCCQSTVLSLLKQGGRTNSSAASQRSKKKVEGKILCASRCCQWTGTVAEY